MVELRQVTTGAVAATPPGEADVLAGFAQQAPPAQGYTLAGFDERLTGMAARQEALAQADDPRAVFALTYLTFSRRVRDALAGGRFTDQAWAADMSCRFVDAYLEQADRWDRRDQSQCRAWRIAFDAAQSGRANVLQAMFLGMNAHIHYDLAFVTLGACRTAGDLQGVHDRSSISRTRLPDARYCDFLLINQVGWESIPHIADTVLGAFAPTLEWGNRQLARVTKVLGQRLLMEARDTSWAHTSLLVHALTDTDRRAVAAMVDAHAASHTHLVETMTASPFRVASGLLGWRNRDTDLPNTARDQLVRMATTNPVVAELALRQLAFAGADPAVVMDALVEAGCVQLTGHFAAMVHRQAPAHRRRDLERYWSSGSRRSRTSLEVVLAGRYVPVDDLPGPAVDAVHDAWQRALDDSARCAALPAVAGATHLDAALRRHQLRLRDQLTRTGRTPRPPPADAAPLSRLQARALLAVHPDRWVRVCAEALEVSQEGDHAMPEVTEQVLFLKSTTVFREVDPGSLLPVAEELAVRTFAEGAVIIRAGDRAEGIHLIADGRVSVTQDREGKVLVVAELGRGDSLGELSVLNDTPATADCTAASAVRTAFLPTSVLAELLHQHPRVAIGLVRVLSQRLTATTLLLRQDGA